MAGVGERDRGRPPRRGEKNPLVLRRRVIAGVDRVFTIGGAQAIAALAYGTQTIPQVDKIGPATPTSKAPSAGVRHRRHRHGGGPSEVLVISDGSAIRTGWRRIFFAQASTKLAQSILLV